MAARPSKPLKAQEKVNDIYVVLSITSIILDASPYNLVEEFDLNFSIRCALFLNVASEFIALSLIVLVGWVLYYFTRRSPLLAFFNIKKPKRIVLYLSHLRIQPGGAIGIGNVPRSFWRKCTSALRG